MISNKNEMMMLIAVAARGIFHWGGKALKNWVWSEIAVAATPKSGIR